MRNQSAPFRRRGAIDILGSSVRGACNEMSYMESLEPRQLFSALPGVLAPSQTIYTGSVPMDPSALTASGTAAEIDLKWVDNGGNETLFKIERRPQSQGANAYVQIGFVGVGSTAFADTTAAPATQYVYRIRSTNGPLDSNYSNEAAGAMNGVTTSPGGGTPGTGGVAAPSSLTATTGAGEIDLKWVDNGSGETLFKIERRLASQGANAYMQVGFVAATSTAYADTTAAAGNIYVYRIRSTNGPTDSPYSNEAASNGTVSGGPTTGPGPGPSPGLASPASLSASSGASGIALAWVNTSTGQSLIKIERRLTAQGTNAYIQIGFVGGSATAYLDTTASSGTSYTYRIRGTNGPSDSGYSNEASTASTPVIPVAPAGGLAISGNGHYLVNADGSPFIWVGDTGWRMVNRLNRADADLYLSDRANKGFTVIQTALVNDHDPVNAAGQSPFINGNPYQPNPAYFSYVDTLVADATARGLTLAIVPCWSNKINGPDGVLFDANSARSYGQYLGGRYKGKNIIWLLGGDGKIALQHATWDALADGLNAGSGGANVVTYHPRGGFSSSAGYAGDPRVQFNMIQSGHVADSSNYDMVTSDYALNLPTIDAEANYEEMPNALVVGNAPITAYDVRKKAYWSLFAGAFGVQYGDMNVYQFWTPGTTPDITSPLVAPWQNSLNAPGAQEMQFVKKLMQSRPVLSRVPDQSVVTSYTGTGTDHIQATRDAAGSYALVYAASGQAVSVDMTKITGANVRVSWYNPRDGSYAVVGIAPDIGTQTFAPPTNGYNNDWILVMDDAAKGFSVN
jgi:hypothetical protein